MIALIGSVLLSYSCVWGYDKEKLYAWGDGIRRDKVVFAINAGSD